MDISIGIFSKLEWLSLKLKVLLLLNEAKTKKIK